MDLVEILKRPEGKRPGFKRGLSTSDGTLKTVGAFANTPGGTLHVAVEDRTRHILGVPDALDLGERPVSLIDERISPHLIPEI